jgi:hypothetical protein
VAGCGGGYACCGAAEGAPDARSAGQNRGRPLPGWRETSRPRPRTGRARRTRRRPFCGVDNDLLKARVVLGPDLGSRDRTRLASGGPLASYHSLGGAWREGVGGSQLDYALPGRARESHRSPYRSQARVVASPGRGPWAIRQASRHAAPGGGPEVERPTRRGAPVGHAGPGPWRGADRDDAPVRRARVLRSGSGGSQRVQPDPDQHRHAARRSPRRVRLRTRHLALSRPHRRRGSPVRRSRRSFAMPATARASSATRLRSLTRASREGSSSISTSRTNGA